MGLYAAVGRPIAFGLPPEASHRLAVSALRTPLLWSLLGRFTTATDPSLSAEFCGIRVPNPVGMAAGFDKDCRVLQPLLSLGFGFAVGGTVTLRPRPGNTRPRLFRDIANRSLVNALGFPGQGVAAAARRLRRLPADSARRTLVSVAGTEDEEIEECHARLEAYVAAVEINISSPNTSGLRDYQEPVRLATLLRKLTVGKKKPLLVKLPRVSEPADLDPVVLLARTAADAGAEGLVVANTLPVADGRLAVGHGGLSGAPLLESTLRLVEAIRRVVPRHVSIVGSGGVFSGNDVRKVMSAGASAVQLYTAFVYQGPGLAGSLCRELLRTR